MAKEKKRKNSSKSKFVFQTEAKLALLGITLFIIAMIGLITKTGLIGNLIRYALVYTIGMLYMLPLLTLAFVGVYVFIMRKFPKIKIGVTAIYFILLIVASAILLSGTKNANLSVNVFDLYNQKFSNLKGVNFALNLKRTSELGGGLIGHVVYYAFAKLLDPQGIAIICYILIFASLFMLIRPLLFHFIRFISLYLTKRGAFERRKNQEDDDEIPPEFDHNDEPLPPNDNKGVTFNTTVLDPEEEVSLVKSEIQPLNPNQEALIEKEPLIVTQPQEVNTVENKNIETQINNAQTVNQNPQYIINNYYGTPIYPSSQPNPNSIPYNQTNSFEALNNNTQAVVEDNIKKIPQVESKKSGPTYVKPSSIEIQEVVNPVNVDKPSSPFVDNEVEVKNEEVTIDTSNKPLKEVKSSFVYDNFIMDFSSKVNTKEEKVKEKEKTPLPSSSPVYIKSDSTFLLPPMSLLKAKDNSNFEENKVYVEERIVLLRDKLNEMKVKAEVVDFKIGPTVSRIEIKPEQGVKVAQVNAIKDDLMMAMAVSRMRMESPIPGKSAIGIEIPNLKRQKVRLSEILAAQGDVSDRLIISLGKDVDGSAISVNLAKMPHLLIAGGSGSGKSVCVNAIITSLLMRYTPSDVRLMLIDLKQVELEGYKDIPHLICPIINKAKETIIALNRLVEEMNKRYEKLKDAGTRDITQYNKLAKINRMEKMPYIVVIIDELANLMNAAAKDVETNIQRLSQLARAAGIHLIFATQRPSVDVIIGVIKTNFLTRIAFQVFSQVDSKVILDRQGAEDLLGDGDMLYSNVGNVVRMQGSFVEDSEIVSIVEYLKNQGKPSYFEEFLNLKEEEKPSVNLMTSKQDNSDDDILYEKIKVYVQTKKNKKVSSSEFQRRFSIGFGRAGRMMDRLEAEGIVSGDNGSLPRDVLIFEVSEGEEE